MGNNEDELLLYHIDYLMNGNMNDGEREGEREGERVKLKRQKVL